jgi:hypothetical protein
MAFPGKGSQIKGELVWDNGWVSKQQNVESASNIHDNIIPMLNSKLARVTSCANPRNCVIRTDFANSLEWANFMWNLCNSRKSAQMYKIYEFSTFGKLQENGIARHDEDLIASLGQRCIWRVMRRHFSLSYLISTSWLIAILHKLPLHVSRSRKHSRSLVPSSEKTGWRYPSSFTASSVHTTRLLNLHSIPRMQDVTGSCGWKPIRVPERMIHLASWTGEKGQRWSSMALDLADLILVEFWGKQNHQWHLIISSMRSMRKRTHGLI